MRIRELVSDWELEEIREELRHGNAPDVVAFRHGLPIDVMPRGRGGKGLQDHSSYRIWTDVEKCFVRDNYPNHDTYSWRGWTLLDRSWQSIVQMAAQLGVTRKRRERPWTDAEVEFVRDNYPNHGKNWDGWGILERTWASVRMKASYMGVRRKVRSVNESWRGHANGNKKGRA